MEGWFGNANAKKVTLKNKAKTNEKQAWEDKNNIKINDIDEVDQTNEEALENPFQTELITFEELEKKFSVFPFENEPENDKIKFLLKEIIRKDNEEEKDEHWEFKSLKNDVSSVIASLYGDYNEFV